MNKKDIKQITDEVVKEGFLSNKPNNPVSDYQNKLRAQGATGVVAAGGVALLLKKLYDSYKKENAPERKAKLKVKILKTKAKLEKLKSKSKKLSEALENFTEEELINEWNVYVQELGGYVGNYFAKKREIKRMKNVKKIRKQERSERKKRKGTDNEKVGDRILDTRAATNIQNTWDTNKGVRTTSKAAVAGVAGILAYKLYKKLKDKYSKATDPKEKAKLKKVVAKAKAKLKK